MNAFTSLMWRCREADRLVSALVELGYRCPMNCVFCYTRSCGEDRPLSREQYLGFFRDLEELGVMFLTFSGGEPTVHRHFFDLGKAARRAGFVLRIKTSGSHLTREEISRIREEIDPFVVEISLHGARAATHERQTRVPGSFRRLLDAVEGFRETGQRVELRCVLSRFNEGEIQDIRALARSLGLLLSIDTEVGPFGGNARGAEILAPSSEALEFVFSSPDMAGCSGGNLSPEDTPDGWRHRYCGAGSSSITLDPNGNILPCPAWRTVLGNLHERSFSNIWRNSKTLEQVRRNNENIARKIRSIEGGNLLAFCPGHAVARGTSPDRIYPQAWRRRDAAAAVSGGSRDRMILDYGRECE